MRRPPWLEQRIAVAGPLVGVGQIELDIGIVGIDPVFALEGRGFVGTTASLDNQNSPSLESW